jgi:hypothetical protein
VRSPASRRNASTMSLPPEVSTTVCGEMCSRDCCVMCAQL